jgi:hypothetical protein
MQTGDTVPPDDDLERWIDDLRARHERGELADTGPIDLGYDTGHFPGETTVRIMLSDLDDLNDPTGSAAGDPAWHRHRLDGLRGDFERLRELLG